MNYILAIFLVGLVVLAHEFGHFIAAKLVAVPVECFSIGFGPKIWGFQKGTTEYRLSLFPIGGYLLPKVKDETQFFNLPVNKRIILAAGGPIASILLTVSCFSLLNILSKGFSFNGLLIEPLLLTGRLSSAMFNALLQAFSQPDRLSSAIGLIAQGGNFIGSNSLNWLLFTASVSLNLGILNLAPLPVLDGGKILLYSLEKIHPKMVRLHYPLALAGWILIIGLTIYITVIDIRRLC
jgi:regulator of sigma E protease